MKSINQAVRFYESAPGATRNKIGLAVSTAHDWAMPGPAVGSVADEDGSVRVEGRGSASVALPLAPVRAIRWMWARLTRLPLGTPSYDADGLARRQVCLREALASVPIEFRQEHAPFIFGYVAHVGCGDLGMTIEDVIGVVHERYPSLAVEDLQAWMLAALEGGAFHAFDVKGQAFDEEGRRLDEAAARAREDEERAKERAVAIEAERSSPNEKTLDELGLLGIEMGPGGEVPRHINAFWPSFVNAGAARLFCIPRALLFGAEFPPGTIGLRVELLDGSFVPKLSRAEAEALQERAPRAFLDGEGKWNQTTSELVTWLFNTVRPQLGIETDASAVAEWDESTADGRYRAECFEKLIEENRGALPVRAPSANAGDWERFDAHPRFVFDAGRFGLSLAEDVTANILCRCIHENWQRLHETAPRRVVCVRDADGNEREAEVSWEKAEAMLEKELEKKTTPPYRAKPYVAPEIYPWCASDEALVDAYRARAQGKKPLFAFDELYISPEPTALERVKDVLTFGDAWAPIVKNLVEERAGEPVVQAAIVDALRAASAKGVDASNRDRRIYKLMTDFGWKKTNKAEVDGRSGVRAWVKP